MDWIILLGVFVAVAAVLLLKRMTFVSEANARQHLAAGGLVIDVRSREEFDSGHVRGAINIPLDELREELPRRVKDKQQPLLVHCLSGGRSAIAKQQITNLGYPNVFNLGSLARAKEIVSGAQSD